MLHPAGIVASGGLTDCRTYGPPPPGTGSGPAVARPDAAPSVAQSIRPPSAQNRRRGFVGARSDTDTRPARAVSGPRRSQPGWTAGPVGRSSGRDGRHDRRPGARPGAFSAPPGTQAPRTAGPHRSSAKHAGTPARRDRQGRGAGTCKGRKPAARSCTEPTPRIPRTTEPAGILDQRQPAPRTARAGENRNAGHRAARCGTFCGSVSAPPLTD